MDINITDLVENGLGFALSRLIGHCPMIFFFFLDSFNLMALAHDDNSLSSDQDITQFLV